MAEAVDKGVGMSQQPDSSIRAIPQIDRTIEVGNQLALKQ